MKLAVFYLCDLGEEKMICETCEMKEEKESLKSRKEDSNGCFCVGDNRDHLDHF